MHAAGRSTGRWSIWSNMRETKGLTTIERPLRITDASK